MAEFGGNNFTQLTYLNVIEELRVGGAVVTDGSGDVVGPGSSIDMSLARFDGTNGTLIEDSVVTLSNNGVFTFATEADPHGLAFDANMTQYYSQAANQLQIDGFNNDSVRIASWDADGTTDSTIESFMLLSAGSTTTFGSLLWAGGLPSGGGCEISLDANSTTQPIHIEDTAQEIGMRYGDDYSTNNASNPLWIPDKGYVDAVGLAATPTIAGVTVVPVTVQILTAQIDILHSRYIIKDENGLATNADPITISTQGSQTIDGETDDLLITTAYGVARLYSDGFNLFGY